MNNIFYIIFYKNFYFDLYNFSNIELIKHYNKYGLLENRFINIKQLYNSTNIFNNFNIDLYKTNNNLSSLNDYQILSHYYFSNINNNLHNNLHNKLDNNLDNNLDNKLDNNLNNKLDNKLDDIIINKIEINKKIYIIHNDKLGGGTTKYVNDFSNYYNCEIIKDSRNLNRQYNKEDTIFIQHLLMKNIKIKYIIDIYKRYKLKIIITIHDFYWLSINNENIFNNGIHNIYLNNNIIINKDVIELFNICYKIIFPSYFLFDIFSKYFNNDNFIKIDHIDYKIEDYDCIPKIIDNNINICNMNINTECKGKEMIEILMDRYNNNKYNDYNINFYCVNYNVDKYKENEFFSIIDKYNIHSLIHLNKWGETWSYVLTKSLLTGLPLLYNNIGVYRERIKDNNKNIIITQDENEYLEYLIDKQKIYDKFEKLLDLIIENNDKYLKKEIKLEYYKNTLYDVLFL